MGGFLERLHGELEERGDMGEGVGSIYFGGGTPSVLGLVDLGGILEVISRSYDISNVVEVTLEANPDHLSAEYLEGLRGLGFNRLSIGVQSLSDDRLRRIGRRHSAYQALEGIKLAQRVGFENISGDLIFGFEDLWMEEWRGSVEGLVESGVQHISAYQLSIESGSRFSSQGVVCASDEVCLEQFSALRTILSGEGFEQYEISNFAREGFRAQHNSGYWSGRKYLGFGPSAHSYDGFGVRSWNVCDLEGYIGGVPPQSETLSPTDQINEYLMTRLRTATGFLQSDFRERFNTDFVGCFSEQLSKSLESGDLVMENNYVRIPPERFFVADSIISDYFVV